MVSSTMASPDVVIIGDGLIGLSTALDLGRAGARCIVLGAVNPGSASTAAAGLLVPSLGELSDRVRPLFMASLELYASFVENLRPFDQTLSVIQGVVERSAAGERVHPRDGAIDNVRLLVAVKRAVEATACVTIIADPAAAIATDSTSVVVTTRGAARISAPIAVLAAGAWAPGIAGLPRPLPVFPLKGQMIALGAAPLSQAVMGDECYLVPRGAETLVGATEERAGFDTAVTSGAVAALHTAAVDLCPALASAPITRSWAGTRPATPDMLPILGPDPDAPRLIYACGHSKNGILLAPVTAASIGALARNTPSPYDLEPFSIMRFS